jgi:hypothetical protein
MLPASLVTGVMIVGDRCPMRACSAWVSDVDEVEMARYPLTSPKGELFVDRNLPQGRWRITREQRGTTGPQKGPALMRGEDRSLESCARVLCSLQKLIGSVGPREARSAHFTRFERNAGTGV